MQIDRSYALIIFILVGCLAGSLLFGSSVIITILSGVSVYPYRSKNRIQHVTMLRSELVAFTSFSCEIDKCDIPIINLLIFNTSFTHPFN